MFKSFAALLFAYFTMTSCVHSVAATGQASFHGLVSEFLDALNSKDQGRVSKFVAEHFDDSVPAEQRAGRFMNLVSQGAPFTVIRFAPDGPGEVRAVIEDKNKEQMGLRVFFSAGSPGKISRLMLGDPEELDAPPPKDYKEWKDLPSLAESIRIDTRNPAMAVAVIRNGHLEHTVTGTRTVDGKDKVGLDEPWSIGSIGKPICATVVGRLIEMGKLDWSTTLGQALSDFPMNEGYKSVTIEQIMHHRGGIPEDPGMRRPDVLRIIGGATDRTKIRENYARDILSRPPIGGPGEKFAYSNAGYALLSVIAERAMKQSYEELVKTLIFEPLGLKHSYTAIDPVPQERPSGHMRGPNGLEVQDMKGPIEILFAGAGGGLFMSVSDLARFGEAHMLGMQGKDGLLKSETVKRLHQGISEGGPSGR